MNRAGKNQCLWLCAFLDFTVFDSCSCPGSSNYEDSPTLLNCFITYIFCRGHNKVSQDELESK